VEFIVFSDKTLVLMLQGQLGLGVELAFLGQNRIFIFDLLKSFSGLQQLV